MLSEMHMQLILPARAVVASLECAFKIEESLVHTSDMTLKVHSLVGLVIAVMASKLFFSHVTLNVLIESGSAVKL